MSKLEHFENKLEQINRVDPPPYLFTRITAQIDNVDRQFFPVGKMLVFSGMMIVLLGLNVSLFVSYSKVTNQQEQNESIWQSMNFDSSNQLYHE